MKRKRGDASPIEGVTLEQLRTLLAVVDAGTFSAAARSLGRVQAAVSQSIERLEAHLGLRLFDRSGRVPRLTNQGREIAGAARRVERGFLSFEDLARGLKQGEETKLSIAIDLFFPAVSLATFATEFAREYPRVELLLHSDILSAVTAHVRERRSSWGIAIEDADMTDLDGRAIASVRILPVASRSHPLASSKTPLDLAALADTTQIVLGAHGSDASTDAPRGVFSDRTWRVMDQSTRLALIEAGLGWGNMPEHVVADAISSGRLVELRLDAWGSVPATRSLILVWRRGVVMGPVARWAQARLANLCRSAVEPHAT